MQLGATTVRCDANVHREVWVTRLVVTCSKDGYKVCAVRYNAQENRAEHYIATNEDELAASMGSKYIQSYTVDGFKAINRKEKNLVIGTPCQIDSFRRYIKRFKVEDNFVLVDFFCHGVPSKLGWNKYLADIEKTTGKTQNATWRNKIYGWHNSYAVTVEGEKGTSSIPSTKAVHILGCSLATVAWEKLVMTTVNISTTTRQPT